MPGAVRNCNRQQLRDPCQRRASYVVGVSLAARGRRGGSASNIGVWLEEETAALWSSGECPWHAGPNGTSPPEQPTTRRRPSCRSKPPPWPLSSLCKLTRSPSQDPVSLCLWCPRNILRPLSCAGSFSLCCSSGPPPSYSPVRCATTPRLQRGPTADDERRTTRQLFFASPLGGSFWVEDSFNAALEYGTIAARPRPRLFVLATPFSLPVRLVHATNLVRSLLVDVSKHDVFCFRMLGH